MQASRIASALGRTLVVAGLLVLAFAGYQLWGTGLETARAQRSLEDDFAERFRAAAMAAATSTTTAPAPTTGPTTSTTTTGPAATTGPAPTTSPTTTIPAGVPPVELVVAPGEAMARIEIPAIDVDKIVVAGVSVSDLRKGPGHYPSTPQPGQVGNAAIAGHRTTYGAPFARLDELEPGDEIVVTTLAGRFTYAVTGQLIVEPSDVWVLDPTETATLTLTACHPRYSARQRIVVRAELVPELSPTPLPPPPGAPPASEPPGDPEATVGTTEPGDDGPGTPAVPTTAAAPIEDPLGAGWFSDPSAWFPALGWGAVCAAVAAAGWAAGRRWRRWPAWILATPVFLVALYACFGGVARLLPPNL